MDMDMDMDMDREKAQSPSGPFVKADLRALHLDAARWHAILETALDAVICIDADGRITLFNPTAEEMFGYCAIEALGQNVNMLMPSPYREEHDQYIASYRRTGVARAIGCIRYVEARRKSGEVFPIELSVSEAKVDAEVIYTAIIRDVTERKRADEAANRRARQQAAVSELGFRALAGANLDELMTDTVRLVARTLDVEYCKILELEADGEHFQLRAGVGWKEGTVGSARVGTGRESQAGYTLSSQEAVIVDDLRTETRFSGPSLLSDHGVVSGVSVVIHSRAGPFGVLGAHTATRRAFTTDDVHFLQAVANVLGTSAERLRAEEAALEFQELARQRERLADIGAIAANIAHDLGNPVAALSLQAELLMRRASRDATATVDTLTVPAQRIASEARRLDRLVSEFKYFARQQRLHRSVIELPQFLDTVLGLWRPVAAGRDVRLELSMPADFPLVVADEGKVRRVLDNLIKNAIEAIDEGPGRVRILVSLLTSEKMRISVEDSGPGIPEGMDAFRLFETTKADGSGLGLSISRQIALAHGGNLDAERVEPHGTVIHLDLPVGTPRGRHRRPGGS